LLRFVRGAFELDLVDQAVFFPGGQIAELLLGDAAKLGGGVDEEGVGTLGDGSLFFQFDAAD
jgi:hypothetical protein